MSKNYKLKIIIAGSTSSGKSSFLWGRDAENDFDCLGISFKSIECVVNECDSYKLVCWDLKIRDRFRFMFPTFCRGATAAILTFDVNDIKSFKELSHWIKIIKNNNKNYKEKFPIILIGTKTDLNNRAVSDAEIDELIEKYNINGVFFTSIHENNGIKKKEAIFKKLIESIYPSTKINKCTVFIPKEDKVFNKFVQIFQRCPICGEKNHWDSLKNLFYSKDPHIKELKEKLFELFTKFEKIGKVKIGIPCCNCFKKYFKHSVGLVG